jgi:hypothetical protein
MIENKHNYDINIETIRNGYIITIGDEKYAISNYIELSKWINENISTPEKAKSYIQNITAKKYGKGVEDNISKYAFAPISSTTTYTPTQVPYITTTYTSTNK